MATKTVLERDVFPATPLSFVGQSAMLSRCVCSSHMHTLSHAYVCPSEERCSRYCSPRPMFYLLIVLPLTLLNIIVTEWGEVEVVLNVIHVPECLPWMGLPLVVDTFYSCVYCHSTEPLGAYTIACMYGSASVFLGGG
jgi:hypothetical protein